MFSSLSSVVIRRPWVVVLGWLVLTAGLYQIAPRWDQVTKDDDVRFFPPDSLSVIGQDLLERGFPEDASSSQLVLVYERKHGRVTQDDLQLRRGSGRKVLPVCPIASRARDQEARHAPLAGDRSPPDRYERRWSGSGGADDRPVERNLSLEEDASRGRRGSSNGSRRNGPRRPAGLELAVTGSAVVGHDTNTAANESIRNTTNSTIALVVLILLVVYRSPLLAMVPLVTIALSVFVSLQSDRAAHVGSGPRVSGDQHHQGLRRGRPLRRGNGLLPLPDRAVLRGAGPRPVEADALREAISQVGAALVASAGTVIVGLGMLYFSSFAKVKYTGPTIALSLAVALLAALTLAPAMLAMLRRGDLLAVPCTPSHRRRRMLDPTARTRCQ